MNRASLSHRRRAAQNSSFAFACSFPSWALEMLGECQVEFQMCFERGLVGDLCPGTPSRTPWQTSSACPCARPVSSVASCMLIIVCCALNKLHPKSPHAERLTALDPKQSQPPALIRRHGRMGKLEVAAAGADEQARGPPATRQAMQMECRCSSYGFSIQESRQAVCSMNLPQKLLGIWCRLQNICL